MKGERVEGNGEEKRVEGEGWRQKRGLFSEKQERKDKR